MQVLHFQGPKGVYIFPVNIFLMNWEVKGNWCASCSFTSGASSCIQSEAFYTCFLSTEFFNEMVTSQETRCYPKPCFHTCQYYLLTYFLVISFVSVILCMRLQRPYIWWKCGKEMMISSGESFIRILSSKPFLYALLTYLLVTLPKDILVGNKNINDHFTSFTEYFIRKHI